MEVIWVTILSEVTNEDKNNKLEDNPDAEVQVIVGSFNVDPRLEFELTREQELDPETAGPLRLSSRRRFLVLVEFR